MGGQDAGEAIKDADNVRSQQGSVTILSVIDSLMSKKVKLMIESYINLGWLTRIYEDEVQDYAVQYSIRGGEGGSFQKYGHWLRGASVARCIQSGSFTAEIGAWYMAWTGAGQEVGSSLRVGSAGNSEGDSTGEVPNPNTRYELIGSSNTDKAVCFTTCASKIATKLFDNSVAADQKAHLVMVLTKSDCHEMKARLIQNGVNKNRILSVTSEERKKRGKDILKSLSNWKTGKPGGVLVVIVTQPFSGINHPRLCGCDMLGSWSAVTAYQALQRLCRGAGDAKGLARMYIWKGMFAQLGQDGKVNEKGGEETKEEGQKIVTHEGLKNAFELTSDSYMAIFSPERCCRDTLSCGRSPGGGKMCPKNSDKSGGDIVSLCSVCLPSVPVTVHNSNGVVSDRIADFFNDGSDDNSAGDHMDIVETTDGGGAEVRLNPGDSGESGKASESPEQEFTIPPEPLVGDKRPTNSPNRPRGGSSLSSYNPFSNSNSNSFAEENHAQGPLSRVPVSLAQIQANARSAIGQSESNGTNRRVWSDDGIRNNLWRCGESIPAINGGQATARGGCGTINPNKIFACTSCGEGKSGWKKTELVDSNKNDSFSCDCTGGSHTFWSYSQNNRQCYSCHEMRGEWHSIFGFNRGKIFRKPTQTNDVFLGKFDNEDKWGSEQNFVRKIGMGPASKG